VAPECSIGTWSFASKWVAMVVAPSLDKCFISCL
jgi:hypothetical protein